MATCYVQYSRVVLSIPLTTKAARSRFWPTLSDSLGSRPGLVNEHVRHGPLKREDLRSVFNWSIYTRFPFFRVLAGLFHAIICTHRNSKLYPRRPTLFTRSRLVDVAGVFYALNPWAGKIRDRRLTGQSPPNKKPRRRGRDLRGKGIVS